MKNELVKLVSTWRETAKQFQTQSEQHRRWDEAYIVVSLRDRSTLLNKCADEIESIIKHD